MAKEKKKKSSKSNSSPVSRPLSPTRLTELEALKEFPRISPGFDPLKGFRHDYQLWITYGHFPHKIPGHKVLTPGVSSQGCLGDTSTSYACEHFLRSYRGDKPFCLSVGIFQPHDICQWLRVNRDNPEKLVFDEIRDELPELPANYGIPENEPAGLAENRLKDEPAKGGWSDEHWRYYRWCYFRMIEQLDAEIGRILQSLDDTGLAKNTMVILTSDHGEGLGHHNMVRTRDYKFVAYNGDPKVQLFDRRRDPGEVNNIAGDPSSADLVKSHRKIRIKENEGGKRRAYAQELFTREAISYIKEKHDNPFFVFLSYTSPHAELGAPAEYVRPYEDQFKETPYTGMSTGIPCDRYAWYYPTPVANPHATLAGMVAALDDYVGQIEQVLKDRGIAENTLVIFTSDNGPHDEGGGDPKFFKASAPYKGIKRDVYDGGIHVPMIVHWPELITKGRVDSTPWAFADVLPTFADLAGVPLQSVPRVKTNGTSIRPLLRVIPGTLPERTLYWEFGKQACDPNSGIVGEVFQAARRGQWKAVRYGKEARVELYDIEKDPGESVELSDRFPDIHSEFVNLFEKYGD